jgi:hypothetical protein
MGCIQNLDTSPDTWDCDGGCNSQTVTEYYVNPATEDDNPGFTGKFYNYAPTCGGLKNTQNCQSSGASCGSTNMDYYTAVPNLSACCPNTGFPCVAGQCCGTNVCINDICTACASNYGQPCPGDCGSQGTYACDGSCLDPLDCDSDADCASGLYCNDDGFCVSGGGGGGDGRLM